MVYKAIIVVEQEKRGGEEKGTETFYTGVWGVGGLE